MHQVQLCLCFFSKFQKLTRTFSDFFRFFLNFSTKLFRFVPFPNCVTETTTSMKGKSFSIICTKCRCLTLLQQLIEKEKPKKKKNIQKQEEQVKLYHFHYSFCFYLILFLVRIIFNSSFVCMFHNYHIPIPGVGFFFVLF